MTVKEIHDEVFEYMNDNFPYFVKHFLALGNPVEVRDTTWARVAWNTYNNEVEFGINPENVDPMDIDQKLFVCMHETMHVLLLHNKFDFPNKQKQNIAQDLVINDYLINKGIPKLEGVCYGPDIIGMDASNMAVKDVYDLLPDDEQGDGTCDNDHGQGGDGSGAGNPGGIPDEFLEWFKNINGVFSDISDAQDDNSDPMQAFGCGGGEGDPNNWVKENNVTMKWAELMEELDPDIFKGKGGNKGRQSYTFNKLNRKVAWMAPRIVLPVKKPNRVTDGKEGESKPLIVVALDTSGSIRESDKKNFITLAKSIPQDKIELRCCTFTTAYRVLDLDKPSYSTGGTDFSAIEKFIQQKVVPELGKYPDAVVVITDGQANFAPPNEPQIYENWLWLFNHNNPMRVGWAWSGSQDYTNKNWRGKERLSSFVNN